MSKQSECILLALDFFRWLKKIKLSTVLLVHIGMDLTSFGSSFQNASSESKKFKFGCLVFSKIAKNEKKKAFFRHCFFQNGPRTIILALCRQVPSRSSFLVTNLESLR
jgi:hypothetical protein